MIKIFAIKLFLPEGLTDNGSPFWSKVAREQVASKPIPFIICESTPVTTSYKEKVYPQLVSALDLINPLSI